MFAALALLLALLQAPATTAPTLPQGSAVLKIDLFSPAQPIRVENLPDHTTDISVVFASLDETVDGTPEGEQYKPRHSYWFTDGTDSGGFSDNWDFIPTNHTYDVTVEYIVKNEDGSDTTFVTNTVRVLHMRFDVPTHP